MECFLYNKCNRKDCGKDFCLRKCKLNSLYNLAMISEKQRQHVNIGLNKDEALDVRDRDAFVKLGNLATNVIDFINEGQNLFLHSSISGNGKTSWALRFAENYLDRIWATSPLTCRVLFISVPRFLLQLKDNISNKSEYVSYIKENVAEADLVIWDDIAAKIGTEFEINHLLSLIDNRICLGKANIFTSNLNRDQMMESLGSRLTSRICNLGYDIELFGTDKRGWVRNGGDK